MRILDKLERKYGKYAIKGLMIYIAGGNILIFLLFKLGSGYLPNPYAFIQRLYLIPQLVMQGEVWRIITFIFIPPTLSLFWIIFSVYFYYLIGSTLENEWGSLKFNIYYFIGLVGTIAAAFITGGVGTPTYLNMSLFLAFAYLFPNYQILLFFILPIKIKYLAWLDAIVLGYLFIFGGLDTKLLVAAAIINFALFFGKDIVMGLKNNRTSYYNKREFLARMPKKETFHKCKVCGITEKDNKDMEFRYCISCEGDYEYCMDHLENHEHVGKGKS